MSSCWACWMPAHLLAAAERQSWLLMAAKHIRAGCQPAPCWVSTRLQPEIIQQFCIEVVSGADIMTAVCMGLSALSGAALT